MSRIGTTTLALIACVHGGAYSDRMEASASFACACGRTTRISSPRATILARELSRCACGAALAAPCAYIDLERRQVVRVEPAPPDSWRTLEATCAAELSQLLVHNSPYLGKLVHELRFRLVFSLEELREKLVLWSHGLDDAVIECVKIRAFTDTPELASPGTRITVDSVADDDTLTCHWSTSILHLPGTWVRDAHRDRDSLTRRFPELFTNPFVSTGRYFPS